MHMHPHENGNAHHPQQSKTGQETADEFMWYGKVDWYVTDGGLQIHYVRPEDFTAAHREDMEANWAVLSPVRLACGRTARAVHIAGIFTRMGAKRCAGCCRATGLPPGKGSPKNDNECRKLLGLEVRA